MSSIHTNNTQLREVETKEEFLIRWNNRLLAPMWQTSAIFLFFLPSLFSSLHSYSVIFNFFCLLWGFMVGKTIWSAKQWKKFNAQYENLYGNKTFVVNGRKRALLKHFRLSFRDLLEFRINVIRYGLPSAVEIATGNPHSILNQPTQINFLPHPVENTLPPELPVLPFTHYSDASYPLVADTPVISYDPDINDPRIGYLKSIDPQK